jgi:V/A-type H+-transporting ATPase subunit D
MAKIRKTKTELKSQRDALERYQKYLPTLELKKQQLRMEVNRMASKINKLRHEQREFWNNLQKWIRLFAEDVDIEQYLKLAAVKTYTDNIAGVAIEVFEKAEIERAKIDLFTTPPWLDNGLDAIENLLNMEIQLEFMETAYDRLSEELRITSQRVNLFEKIKIPQSQENIRIIRISLGDAQAAAVARAKIAKKKAHEAGMSTI